MISMFAGELLALVFVGLSSQLALSSGIVYLLFPEMGALAYDTFKRPQGVWAKASASIFLATTLGALVGTLISRELPPGFVSFATCVVVSVGLLRLARSPMAPALSAAYLPVALHVQTWLYALSIAIVTGTLASLLVARRKLSGNKTAHSPVDGADDVDDALEKVPRRHAWVAAFGVFLTLAYATSQVTRLPLVLFPPLIVIAYEMFAHAEVCPWAHRPLTLPVACIAGASVGAVSVLWLGIGPMSTLASLTAAIVVMRTLRLHMPPVLGISLLPQVFPQPGWTFILAIAIGTIVLSAFFLAVRPLLTAAGIGNASRC